MSRRSPSPVIIPAAEVGAVQGKLGLSQVVRRLAAGIKLKSDLSNPGASIATLHQGKTLIAKLIIEKVGEYPIWACVCQAGVVLGSDLERYDQENSKGKVRFYLMQSDQDYNGYLKSLVKVAQEAQEAEESAESEEAVDNLASEKTTIENLYQQLEFAVQSYNAVMKTRKMSFTNNAELLHADNASINKPPTDLPSIALPNLELPVRPIAMITVTHNNGTVCSDTLYIIGSSRFIVNGNEISRPLCQIVNQNSCDYYVFSLLQRMVVADNPRPALRLEC